MDWKQKLHIFVLKVANRLSPFWTVKVAVVTIIPMKWTWLYYPFFDHKPWSEKCCFYENGQNRNRTTKSADWCWFSVIFGFWPILDYFYQNILFKWMCGFSQYKSDTINECIDVYEDFHTYKLFVIIFILNGGGMLWSTFISKVRTFIYTPILLFRTVHMRIVSDIYYFLCIYKFVYWSSEYI